jgi:hypothetical protein
MTMIDRALAWSLPLLILPWSPAVGTQQCNAAIARTAPAERFDLHGDGTAADRRTGLVWQRCAVGQTWRGGRCDGEPKTFDWNEAKRRFGQPDSAGWRLPGLKELASIAELACWAPAIDLKVFPDTQSAGFWSASSVASGSAYAWGLNFYDGYDFWYGRGYAFQVRLVRAGQ